jgi:hypothetical protein
MRTEILSKHFTCTDERHEEHITYSKYTDKMNKTKEKENSVIREC